jgi:hypothetical protein
LTSPRARRSRADLIIIDRRVALGGGRRVGTSVKVLLCFAARLFEHTGEKVSDRFASVVLREHQVRAGYAALFRALETCDLLGCEPVGEVSPANRAVVVFGRG